MSYLFCYGTLKRGFCRNGILSSGRFVGEVATKPKYMLFDLGSYPALAECVNGVSVKGELYDIPDELWDRLDLIEAAPYLYDAKPIEIEGVSELVRAYFYQRDTTGLSLCGEQWNGYQEERTEAFEDADCNLSDVR